MNIKVLDEHIKGFMNKMADNEVLANKHLNERAQRIAYYQTWTSEKIKLMTQDDVYEYLSRLWAMLIWGNKQYYIDKVINNNGLNHFRSELAKLVWGNDDVAKRWDSFRKEINGLGPAMISEILCHTHPDDFMIWNRRAYAGLDYLGVKDLPRYDYQVTGDKYKMLCNVYKNIATHLRDRGFKDTTLLSVDYFVWDELQVVDNLSTMHERSKKIEKEIVPKNVTDVEAAFIHNDIRDAISEIGNFLGFEASIERKVAEGSKVDTIWESKIGNMGRVIYVFEVQTKGSIDSLLMNLIQAMNNAAVQGVIAVSDKEQLEKIRKRASTIPNLKDRLRYWDYEEILKVKDSLQFVNDSINKLKLVPESF